MESEPQERHELLASAVRGWALDVDRSALALVNAIRYDSHPGRFVNAFRLLETVIDRAAMHQIGTDRTNSGISDNNFLLGVRRATGDLKTKLQFCLEGCASFPEQILKQLWRLSTPDRGYNKQEVYASIARFRHKHVHGVSAAGDPLILPWEQPSFDGFADALLELTACIVNESRARCVENKSN